MAGQDRYTARIAVIGALGVIATFVAGKAARDAILLTHFDVTRVPVFAGIAAAVSLPIVLLASRALARFGPGRLMPALNVISALLLVGEWALLVRAPQAGAVCVFLHLATLGSVFVSGFWSIINERFDVRSARQHIGRIGMGATLGGIVGGVIVERSAVYLPASSVLLVLAAMQLICAGLLRSIAGEALATASVAEPLRSAATFGLIAKTPLLRRLAGVVVLGAIAATALDYVFKVEVVAATGDEGPLRLFALFYTVANIITAFAQILFGRAVISRLGAARSVVALPATATLFTAGAIAVPGLLAVGLARGAEMVMRSSIYRAAYELIFTPLPNEHKRSTKIVLDVGAERLGDLAGAQLIGLLIYVAAPTPTMLIAGAIAAVGALALAVMLPRAYTRALEHSLMVRGAGTHEHAISDWSTVAIPTLTDSGDLTALSLLALPQQVQPARDDGPAAVATISIRDPITERVADLRSDDEARVKRALTEPLSPELAAHVIPLIGWNAVAADATAALRAVAASCSGLLVDTLLDGNREFGIRRRIPPILEAAATPMAIWGLWRGAADARFEVRYRCVKALARLRAGGHALGVTEADVFAAIRRELAVDIEIWRNYRLLDPVTPDAPATESDVLEQMLQRRASRGLEHVFALLALVFQERPVQIALQGLFTDDAMLRGTALEYIESVLPPDLRTLMEPRLEQPLAATRARPQQELVEALTASQPSIVANLRARIERES